YMVGDMRKRNIPTLEQGDVVIFKYPHNPFDKYVKRLIAGPGQTVEIRNREIMVDGMPFDEPEHLQFLDRDMEDPRWSDPNIFPRGNGNKDNYGPIRIPSGGDRLSPVHERDALWYVASMDGHSLRRQGNTIYVDNQAVAEYTVEQDYYFMMGDNRDQSFDSRFWGFVPHKYILGEVLFVYFSLNLQRLPFVTLSRLKRIGTLIR
ncbi:MAG: signal peptidase I, partial [Candidatus Neomarinimicrobiota bacterium]